MQKKTKRILIGVTVLILALPDYYLFSIGYLFYYMDSQMRVGRACMDSITEKDIPIWHDPDPAESLILGMGGNRSRQT